MLTQLELIQNLKDTFTGFVKVIRHSIKSKHNWQTTKVPIITMMIAEAVNNIKHGPGVIFL